MQGSNISTLQQAAYAFPLAMQASLFLAFPGINYFKKHSLSCGENH